MPDARFTDIPDLEPAAAGFALRFRPASAAGALPCWLAVPRRPRADAPALVAVHGIQRGARDIAAAFGGAAAAAGQVVIAPLFDKAGWPSYQRVVLKGRADLALLALLDELAHEGLAGTRRFGLFGYSGGAQFAHRFAMLYPHRIERLIAAAAGWYTMPDAATAFPAGLGAEPGRRLPWGPRLATGLGAFLQLPVTVLIGERDRFVDASTRSTPALDRQQGPHRRARAERWVEALEAAARARRLAPRVALRELPGCGHDFLECVARGGLVGEVFAGAAAGRAACAAATAATATALLATAA